MISSTFPEPLFDTCAQALALFSREHPKKAVWISSGTANPVSTPQWFGVHHARFFTGELFSLDSADCERLTLDPSDETLADILGYIEPKSTIVGVPVVVQARDHKGAVITEMACSAHMIGRAAEALKGHGEVVYTTLPWAHIRRDALLNVERRRQWAYSTAS